MSEPGSEAKSDLSGSEADGSSAGAGSSSESESDPRPAPKKVKSKPTPAPVQAKRNKKVLMDSDDEQVIDSQLLISLHCQDESGVP